jgi:hypothetical protein
MGDGRWVMGQTSHASAEMVRRAVCFKRLARSFSGGLEGRAPIGRTDNNARGRMQDASGSCRVAPCVRTGIEIEVRNGTPSSGGKTDRELRNDLGRLAPPLRLT